MPSTQPSDPTAEWLTLAYVSRLFGQDHRTIKKRANAGEFTLRVEGNHVLISRESVMRHMTELEERHARRE